MEYLGKNTELWTEALLSKTSNPALSQLPLGAWGQLLCVSQEETENHMGPGAFHRFGICSKPLPCVGSPRCPEDLRDLLYVLLSGDWPRMPEGKMTNRTALSSIRHFFPEIT